jgi:hypothetical protein
MSLATRGSTVSNPHSLCMFISAGQPRIIHTLIKRVYKIKNTHLSRGVSALLASPLRVLLANSSHDIDNNGSTINSPNHPEKGNERAREIQIKINLIVSELRKGGNEPENSNKILFSRLRSKRRALELLNYYWHQIGRCQRISLAAA